MKRSSVLAASLFATTVIALVVSFVLTELARGIDPDQPPLFLILPLAPVLLAGALVGAAVAARQPRNGVGWLFLSLPLALALMTGSGEYGKLGLPGGEYAEWVNRAASAALFCSPPLALLLFPDGRLPSRRWRAVAWLPVAAAALVAISYESGPLPLVLFVASAIVAVAAPLVRFRAARGVPRQQLKWIFYAGALVLVAVALMTAARVTGYQTGGVAWIFFLFSLAIVPVAAGVAILRYRLYDIDVLINRTLVYGAVSATLGATYIAAVVLLQALLRPVTGGSEFAVALSTLLVVALFQPIRRRAQDAVDRRFYRARYDASRTIDAFAVRLRGDVDLDAVRSELISVIHDTIHPAHASVWLRGTSR